MACSSTKAVVLTCLGLLTHKGGAIIVPPKLPALKPSMTDHASLTNLAAQSGSITVKSVVDSILRSEQDARDNLSSQSLWEGIRDLDRKEFARLIFTLCHETDFGKSVLAEAIERYPRPLQTLWDVVCHLPEYYSLGVLRELPLSERIKLARELDLVENQHARALTLVRILSSAGNFDQFTYIIKALPQQEQQLLDCAKAVAKDVALNPEDIEARYGPPNRYDLPPSVSLVQFAYLFQVGTAMRDNKLPAELPVGATAEACESVLGQLKSWYAAVLTADRMFCDANPEFARLSKALRMRQGLQAAQSKLANPAAETGHLADLLAQAKFTQEFLLILMENGGHRWNQQHIACLRKAVTEFPLAFFDLSNLDGFISVRRVSGPGADRAAAAFLYPFKLIELSTQFFALSADDAERKVRHELCHVRDPALRRGFLASFDVELRCLGWLPLAGINAQRINQPEERRISSGEWNTLREQVGLLGAVSRGMRLQLAEFEPMLQDENLELRLAKYLALLDSASVEVVIADTFLFIKFQDFHLRGAPIPLAACLVDGRKQWFTAGDWVGTQEHGGVLTPYAGRFYLVSGPGATSGQILSGPWESAAFRLNDSGSYPGAESFFREAYFLGK